MATSKRTVLAPKYVKHAKNSRLVGEYKLEHTDDVTSCLLRSCTHLPGHGYVMIDRANGHIKLVVTGFKCTSILKLTSCPFDICVSGKNVNEFYVTEPDMMHVHCVVVEKEKMRIKKSVDIGEECRGITCWNGGVAVSVMREGFRGVLGLLDYNCKIKKKVWETELHTELFKAPWYLASIKGGTELVISDQGNHSVICLNAKTLTTTFVLKDVALSGPRSLCVDARDNIYVIASSEACHNVVKLSPEGKLLSVLLSRKDKLYFPSGICCNMKDNTIMLQTYRENPTVSVYML